MTPIPLPRLAPASAERLRQASTGWVYEVDSLPSPGCTLRASVFVDTILCHTVRSTRAAPSKLWISDLTSALVRSTVRSSERPFRADVGVRLLEGDIVTDLLISVEERRILLATMEPPIVEIVPDEPFSSILRILRRALPTNQVIGDAIEEEEAAVLRSQSKSENGSPLWPDCVPGAAAGEFVFYEDEPVPIATPEPVLPPGTKQREVTRVTLHVFVDRSGRVCFAKVIKGMEPFASSAIEAARHWTFKPAMSHGKPVGVWVELPFTFKP